MSEKLSCIPFTIMTIDRFRCPLCFSFEYQVIERLTVAQISDLWAENGITFLPNNLFPGKSLTSHIELMQCNDCRFLFGDSRLAGDSHFYDSLHSDIYYSAERPEFPRTIHFAKVHSLNKVLDFGCGTGAFLDKAKLSGLMTFGAELNETALQHIQSQGHIALPGPLDTWNKEYRGSFDLICLFQVLEHVPSPMELLLKLSSFLKPGGSFSISVPNRHGVLRLSPFEPSNWPPHHLSHWRAKDLRHLAKLINFSLLQLGTDRLYGRRVEQVLRNSINQQARLFKKAPAQTSWPFFLSLIYRFTGLKFCPFFHGDSLFCFMQKPMSVRNKHPLGDSI